MALGTIFTLLVIPSLYVLIAKQHRGEAPGAIAQNLDQEEAAQTEVAQELEAMAK